jgi:predicted O-methyltransferase YrrM
MNTDIPLENIIDDNYRFIITKGWNGINSGVFFIKNCDWSKEFLKNVYARTDCINKIWPEQIAIAEELEKPENSPFAKIVPNRLFNSFSADIGSPHSSSFNSGDFIAHFAGVGRSTWLAALFDKYVTQVVHDRTLITLDFFLGIYGFNLSPTHSTNNEGYMSNEQSKQFQDRLALHPNIESIMEIGLNGGHSADNFFRTCKNLKKFVSFDINMHAYTPVAVEYFRRTYKEIFEFVQGDSTVTVPNYAQQSPDTKFDLIYIDGGHSYEICYIDLLNCKKLAHPKTLVWIDDFNAPNIAWAIRDLQNIGVLELLDVHSSWGPDGMRVWAELRYLP